MSEPDRVTYKVLLSDGNYSHVEIGVDLNLTAGETVEAGLERARKFVRARVKADYRKMGDLRGWDSEEEPEEVRA